MSILKRWTIGLGVSVMLVAGALAQTGGVACVVCGEATEGGEAVILGTQAYPVHAYGCKPVWERAVELGLLDKLEAPIQPGHPVFATPELREAVAGETPKLPGNVKAWTALLIGACMTSGTMAMIFSILTDRPRPAAFVLGFLLPAVGMVLVPVLPKRSRDAE